MWTRYTRTLIIFAVSVLFGLAAFIALVNPYGNLPPGPRDNIIITDVNQRFTYPQIVRSGRYDALIIGTSTTRLIPPERLSERLDMRFAALAMNSARAWEQYLIADLFLRTVPDPKGVLVGIDRVWCEPDADTVRFTRRRFPEWMYDDNPWNDLLYMFNGKALEIAIRQFAFYVGLRDRFRYRDDGYGVFVPPDDEYDSERAKQKIWQFRSPDEGAIVPAYSPTDEERAGWRYPALGWLEEILTRFPADATKIIATMPVHIAYQPLPGSLGASREAECKRRIAVIAEQTGAVAIDFRIQSELTSNDLNYWDMMHIRLPVAENLADWIGNYVASGSPNPDAPYEILTTTSPGGSLTIVD